jgi:hypothetical protein
MNNQEDCIGKMTCSHVPPFKGNLSTSSRYSDWQFYDLSFYFKKNNASLL